ncbi:MAG: VOC family protein [Anaerolineae bacterium]
MPAKFGKIIWFDLTVEHAETVRDFYQQVIGWTPDTIDMETYQDYSMKASDGSTAAGICHKQGENAPIPSQWMLYITVANLDESLKSCVANGGKVLVPTRSMGASRFAVIEDPAGAVCSLFEQEPS